MRRYDGPINSLDIPYALTVDASGKVYVTGASYGNDFTTDLAVVSYDEFGNELWVRRYSDTSYEYDEGNSVLVDVSGNVYVSGSIGYYSTIIKFDSNGNELWKRAFVGDAVYTNVRSMVVDASGNVYITGTSANYDPFGDDEQFDEDFITVKYDSNGNVLWSRKYKGVGPYTSGDGGTSLAVDIYGNVYVTGRSWGNGAFYATIKYDANGNLQWVRRYTNNCDLVYPKSIVVNAYGDVYVTGNCGTLKYDASGNELWSKSTSGNSIALDFSGNLYITGEDGTIKFDVAGNEVWKRNNNGNSLVLDVAGSVYVAGAKGGDYSTVKYDSNGNQLWIIKYNGPGSGDDEATSLAVDAKNNLYVTGRSYGIGVDYDYVTIKYSQNTMSPLVVNAGKDQHVYLGYGSNCLTLTAKASEGSAPYKYKWSPGGGTSSSVKVCPAATTTYTVTVTDANGQTASDEVKVNVMDVRCGNKGDKVLVCHKGKTLCISRNAVDAHLRHGDQVGSCSGSDLNSITENSEAAQLIEEGSKQFHVSIAPNPFSTTTTIQYTLPASGSVSIKVYDVLGREVTTVLQAELKAGVYSTDLSAASLAKGVYYYRALLTTQEKTYTQTGKLMVAK